MNYETPSFLLEGGALEWDALGYRWIETPGVNLTVDAALRHENPWIVYAAVLDRVKSGRFEALPVLIDSIRMFEDEVLWRYCSELLGDAGSSSLLKVFAQRVREGLFDPARFLYQLKLCHAFHQSMLLWSVPLMLEIYLNSNHRGELDVVPVFLSDLLEPEPGPVAYATLADEVYRQLVMEKYRALAQANGGDDVAVLHGSPFSVRALAQRLHTRLVSEECDEDRVVVERHRFEAATGIDCSGFFEDAELRPLSAVAIIEEFLDGPVEAKYTENGRCFWGHRIAG